MNIKKYPKGYPECELIYLYKGKRLLIIDNRINRDFCSHEDVIVWDKRLEMAIGFANFQEDSSLKGYVPYGPHEIPIKGRSIGEFAQDAFSQLCFTLAD